MNKNNTNKLNIKKFSAAYLAALHTYLKEVAGDLQVARSLGRQALDIGVETEVLAGLHNLGLSTLLLPEFSAFEETELTARATVFLKEILATMAVDSPPPATSSEAVRETSENHTAHLLKKSRRLEDHLQEYAWKIMATNEEERKQMSLLLQDEIAQSLLGLHMTLVALNMEATSTHDHFLEEINTIQRLVEASVQTINRFTRAYDLVPKS